MMFLPEKFVWPLLFEASRQAATHNIESSRCERCAWWFLKLPIPQRTIGPSWVYFGLPGSLPRLSLMQLAVLNSRQRIDTPNHDRIWQKARSSRILRFVHATLLILRPDLRCTWDYYAVVVFRLKLSRRFRLRPPVLWKSYSMPDVCPLSSLVTRP